MQFEFQVLVGHLFEVGKDLVRESSELGAFVCRQSLHRPALKLSPDCEDGALESASGVSEKNQCHPSIGVGLLSSHQSGVLQPSH